MNGLVGIAAVTWALVAAGCVAATGAQVSEVESKPSGDVRPSVMSFGASVSDMQVALADDCTTIALREVDVAIPGIARQEQIDCRGFDYFGAPRLAEFVFGDGRLMIAWILVETPELDALEAAFTAQYGAPTHKTPMLAAYADDQAVVRRDTPEAGFYAPALDAPYRGFFDAQVAAASE